MKKILIILAVFLVGCSSTQPKPKTAPLKISTEVSDYKFKNGAKGKKVKTYYANGVLRSEATYLYDFNPDYTHRRVLMAFVHGDFILYYPNGKLDTQATFHKDKLNGNMVMNFESGRRAFMGTYNKGKPIGKFRAYNDTDDTRYRELLHVDLNKKGNMTFGYAYKHMYDKDARYTNIKKDGFVYLRIPHKSNNNRKIDYKQEWLINQYGLYLRKNGSGPLSGPYEEQYKKKEVLDKLKGIGRHVSALNVLGVQEAKIRGKFNGRFAHVVMAGKPKVEGRINFKLIEPK